MDNGKKHSKKVLFVATVNSHIELFHLPFLDWFKRRGYEIHVATDTEKPIRLCDKKIKLPIKRSPFSLSNLRAVRQLKKHIRREKYDIIQANTPMGGVVARLAARSSRKRGTRVIYMAHGLHFYKGAPLLNWLLFYPVEKYLAKFTDTMVLINHEDFLLAKRKFKKCPDIQYVPGVGVSEWKFQYQLTNEQRRALRSSIGIKDGDLMMTCVGRLDKNKNQGLLISTTNELLKDDKRYHLVLAGADEINGKYQRQAHILGIENNVHFLGFCEDVSSLLGTSDIAVSASLREGLPVNILEAMAAGKPIVATDCRGNRDLLLGRKNSRLVEPGDPKKFAFAIKHLPLSSVREPLGEYEISSVLSEMGRIYRQDYLTKEHLLSVIVPVYNAENYIEDCLESIINQDHEGIKLEIIVVDDGSTDGSAAIAHAFAERHPGKVKIFRKANGGVSSARNAGMRIVAGDYLYFVDADDIVSPHALKTISRIIRHDEPDCIVGDFQEFKKGNPKIAKSSSKVEYFLGVADLFKRRKISLHLGANVVRTELLKNNDIHFPETSSYTEDLDVIFECLMSAQVIAKVNQTFYAYRKSGNSATSRASAKRVEDVMEFVSKWENRAQVSMKSAEKRYMQNFVAYQLLIACGLASLDGNQTLKSLVRAKTYLLENGKGKKIKLGKMAYKLFGYDKLSDLCAFYLRRKGGLR